MKIAFIYDAVYPWIKGGVEKRIFEMGRRLAAEGNEVYWFGISWWGDREIEHSGIRLIPCYKPVELYSKGRRKISEAILFAASVKRKANFNKFDVVDCQVFPYFPALFISHQNLVLTWHEFWGDYWKEYLGHLGYFGKAVERIVAANEGKHVAVSSTTARQLLEVGVEAEVVPNGVDLEEIERVKAAEKGYDVVFAGRLIKEKGVDLLLDALKLIPDTSCLIVGEGPEKKRLVEKSRKLGLNCHFHGFTSWEGMISIMKSSKVFALPSTREGFSITSLEANACGMPVVTINHPCNAASEIVCGITCDDTAKSLAEALVEAMERKKKLRGRCVKNVRKYDWDKITRRMVEVYER
ncbi:MAG: glycosyltransferase family 4 protein [Archaeoglobus sp.]|uniref:glycosyltransferase family 4 protein n=1 Tax=Archaeoglobus sp. TaxID=1872626 RepID=UPI001D1D993C|nr:glycosyltransferase family 4 protein [Archaeoglobus sp.]MBO8180429.1 glycosyltransferase family 4 protein [Archaeoglobus sp.]